MQNYYKSIRFLIFAFLCGIALISNIFAQDEQQVETFNVVEDIHDTINNYWCWAHVDYQYISIKRYGNSLDITFIGHAWAENGKNDTENHTPPVPFDPDAQADRQDVKLEVHINNSAGALVEDWVWDICHLDEYGRVNLFEANNGSDTYTCSYTNRLTVEQSVKIYFFIISSVCPDLADNETVEKKAEFTSMTFHLDASPLPPAQLNLPTAPVDFGTTSTSKSFIVKNTGGLPLDWNSSKSPDNWFEYAPIQGNISGGNQTNIAVTADRLQIPQNELQNKDHYGSISFTSNGGSGSVQIKVSIVKPSKPQNLAITNGGSQGQNPHLTWNVVSLVYRYIVERKNVTLGTSYVALDSVASNSYTDSTLSMVQFDSEEFAYRVKAVNGAGSSYYSNIVTTEGIILNAFDSGGPKTLMFDLPKQAQLDNSYPNPGNPGTTIRFGLPEDGQVTLKVFNVRGELVRTLIHCQKPAGFHEIYWDGLSDQGNAVVSGFYIFILEAGGQVQHKKFSLIR